jgi:hypothetical protein
MSFLLKRECITSRGGRGDVRTQLSLFILSPANGGVALGPRMSLSKHHSTRRKTARIADWRAIAGLPHANVALDFFRLCPVTSARNVTGKGHRPCANT